MAEFVFLVMVWNKAGIVAGTLLAGVLSGICASYPDATRTVKVVGAIFAAASFLVSLATTAFLPSAADYREIVKIQNEGK